MQGHRGLEHVPAHTVWETGFNLDRSTVYHKTRSHLEHFKVTLSHNHFTLLLSYISEGEIVLFPSLHLFNWYIYFRFYIQNLWSTYYDYTCSGCSCAKLCWDLCEVIVYLIRMVMLQTAHKHRRPLKIIFNLVSHDNNFKLLFFMKKNWRYFIVWHLEGSIHTYSKWSLGCLVIRQVNYHRLDHIRTELYPFYTQRIKYIQ